MKNSIELTPFTVIQGGITDEEFEILDDVEHPVLFIVAHPERGLVGVFTDKNLMIASTKDLPAKTLLIQEIVANTRQDLPRKGK